MPSTLLVCAALGIFSGLFSGLLTQMVYTCEDFFQKLPIHWMWWPVIGGFAIGLGGLIEPRALGVGYDNIADLLNGTMSGEPALRPVDGQGPDLVDRAGLGAPRAAFWRRF